MIRVEGIEPTRIRPILEVPSVSQATPYVPISLPAISSSIAPAAKTQEESIVSPFRPSIKEENAHYMKEVFRFYSEMERLAQMECKLGDLESRAKLDQLMEIDKKRAEMMRDRANEIQSKKTWSALGTIAQYLASASSIAIGITILGAAPIAGGFLIASGVLGLINRFVSDSIGWESIVARFTKSQELQVQYAQRIDSVLVYTSTILSIASTIGAYYAGALGLAYSGGKDKLLGLAVQAISYSGTVAQWASRLGVGNLDYTINNISAELKTQEANQVSIQQEIHVTTDNMRRILELSQKISETIKYAIASMQA